MRVMLEANSNYAIPTLEDTGCEGYKQQAMITATDFVLEVHLNSTLLIKSTIVSVSHTFTRSGMVSSAELEIIGS